MWVTIRSVQGLSPNRPNYTNNNNNNNNNNNKHNDDDAKAAARVARHARLFVRHEVKPHVPSMHHDVLTPPHDDMLFAKLRRWLLDERAHARAQALERLIDVYTEQRAHRVRSLSYGFVPLLLSALLHDEQSELRARAAVALELLVSEAAAQTVMLRLHAASQASAHDTPPPQRQRRHDVTAEDEVDDDDNDDDDGTRHGSELLPLHDTTTTSPPPPSTHTAATRSLSSPSLSPVAQLLRALDDASAAVVTAALRVCAACHAYHNSFALTALLVQHGSVTHIVRLLDDTRAAAPHSTALRAAACAALLPIFDVKEAYVRLLQLNGVRCVTSQLRLATAAMATTSSTAAVTTASASPSALAAAADAASVSCGDDMHACSLAAAAAQVLARVCEYAEGRRAALRQSSLSALLPCVSCAHACVRAAAAAAMAQMTVLEAAKQHAVDALTLTPLLVAWLQREDDAETIVYVVRLLYHIAEYPPARSALRVCAPRLREVSARLREHADVARGSDDDVDKYGNDDDGGGGGGDAKAMSAQRQTTPAATVAAVAAIDATLRLFARP